MATIYAIPLKDVPNYLPKRNGKKVHRSTITRWATKGVKGRILDTQRVGGIRYTTVVALQKFLGTTRHDPVEQQRLQKLIQQMDRTQGKRA